MADKRCDIREDHVSKGTTEQGALVQSALEIAKKSLKVTHKAAQKYVVQPSQKAIETVSGQAVLNEVRAYVAEEERINTALVTRVLKVERTLRFLKYLIVGLAVAELLHWIFR